MTAHLKALAARPAMHEVIQTEAESAVSRSTPFDELPEFLSPEEFRHVVGIGRSTVYDLLRRDELEHVRFGRCIRIPKRVLASAPPAARSVRSSDDAGRPQRARRSVE
jgi:excisionase family DNA binding protein